MTIITQLATASSRVGSDAHRAQPVVARRRRAPSRPHRALFCYEFRAINAPSNERRLLGAAWQAVLGKSPNPKAAAMLTAHWALETDAGRCMPGHNFAGIKASPSSANALLQTVEGRGAGRREVSARFRVYASAEAGARDYLQLLAARYPAAISAAESGDAAAFTAALARGHYFTADPAEYAAGLEQRLRAPETGSASPPVSAPGALARVALLGLLHALQEPRDDA